MPEGAVYVGEGPMGNLFGPLRTPRPRARACRRPPRARVGFDGRISANGMRHDYHHPGGRVTEVHVG